MVGQERLIILSSKMAVHGIKINWIELTSFERDLVQFTNIKMPHPVSTN